MSLLGVKEIAERYACSPPKARQLIRQMRHIELPKLMVHEDDLAAWEQSRMIDPALTKRTAPRMARYNADYRIPKRR